MAGLGMVIAAATTSSDPSTATTAIRESSDTLTQIALAISRAGHGPALIDPSTAVAARAELTRFTEQLADQTWTIPDNQNLPDPATRNRRVREAVLHDLDYPQ